MQAQGAVGAWDSGYPAKANSLLLAKSLKEASGLCKRAFELANISYTGLGYNRFVCMCNRRNSDGEVKIEIVLTEVSANTTSVFIAIEHAKKTPLTHLFALRYVEYIRGSIEKLDSLYPEELALAVPEVPASRDTVESHKVRNTIYDLPIIAGKSKYPNTGALLVMARCITSEQLDEAQRRSVESGWPIGRELVLMGAVKHAVLIKLVELQRLLHAGTISVNEVVRDLQSESNANCSSWFGASKRKRATNNCRLGDLLTLGGFLAQSDLLNALESAFEQQLSTGDALLQLGLIDSSTLHQTLELQTRVLKGDITREMAVDSLRTAHKARFGGH